MYRNAVVCLCLSMIFVGAVGCRGTTADSSDIEVDLTLDPSPPRVGDTGVFVELSDAQGAPVKGATVRLEGNMNHAGMKPSFADLNEAEPGRYTGTLDFTMGGDWFVLVTAETSDGKRVERKIDVPGVKSQ